MDNNDDDKLARLWGELRFAVIAGLLKSPPARGELCKQLDKLAKKRWKHPESDEWIRMGRSTIERWYYSARDAQEPQAKLTRKRRRDAGKMRAMSRVLLLALVAQYKRYPNWSYKLHADNLAALVDEDPAKYGPKVSYSTVRRCMQQQGLRRTKLLRNPTPGQRAAAARLAGFEVRSYEASHVNALWHLDFHQGSLRVADCRGEWHTVLLVVILDDHSRLCCHAQWYLNENAENLAHALTQAILKRGLPRSLMEDNGSAMRAAETRNGLKDLNIEDENTVEYSPYQNGKVEVFWNQIEGRLLPMLTEVKDLTLDLLNRATQAVVEQEYNRKEHEETGQPPLERYVSGPNAGRWPAPSMERLARAFTCEDQRTVRQSDKTLSIEGVRFEVPQRLGDCRRLTVRWRRWDLSSAWVIDPRNRESVAQIRPLDKQKNADGRRRAIEPTAKTELLEEAASEEDSEPMPPLLRRLMAEYSATGLPPAYLPKDEARLAHHDTEDNHDERT